MKKAFETISKDCATIRQIQKDHPCTAIYIAALIYLLAGFMFCYGYFAGSLSSSNEKDKKEEK